MRNVLWAVASALFILSGLVYGPAIAQPAPGPGRCSVSNLAACPSPFYNAPNINSQAANVVAYGADPTGVNDSTSAINSALATGRAVYLPTGTYLVTNSLNGIGNGAVIYGDGMHSTIIHVTSAFSSSASGVLVMSATGSQQTPGATVHDLQIQFDQPTDQTSRANFAALGVCTTGTGGTGCKYPPALYDVVNGSRAVVYNVTVAGAWDGFYFGGLGNVVNDVFWLTNIEMGALDVGLSADGGEDASHIKGWHSWPFGLSNGNTHADVYNDYNTVAWNIGREDGLQASDVFTEAGNIIFNSDFVNSEAPALIAGGNLDEQLLSISGGQVVISDCVMGVALTPVAATVQVSGGFLTLSNDSMGVTTKTTPYVSVTGGTLNVFGGYVNDPTTSPVSTFYSQTGGNMRIQGQYFTTASPAPTPVISSTGGGTVILNNGFHPATGPALSIISDNASNYVYGNNFGGMSVVLPTGSALSGTYAVAVSVAGPATDVKSLGMGQGTLSQLPSTAVEATGFGYGALNGAMTSAATGDTAFGYLACNSLTTSSNTVCLGNQAGSHITTGMANTILGGLAGQSISTGQSNVFIGQLSGNAATGSSNTFVGQSSGSGSASGNNNVLVGSLAASGLTTGANNICLGTTSCASLTTGSNNVIIGQSKDVATASTGGEINIGGMFFSNGSGAPVLSACGGTPAIDSRATGHTGTVTTGTGSPLTSCTVTFATAYSTWSHCVVSSQTTGNGFGYTYTDSAITITGTSIGSEVFDYACEGY